MKTEEVSQQARGWRRIMPFRLRIETTPERRREVYEDVEEMSSPSSPFYIMVAVSTTIAAYGLLANSTAVVIGAMLLAPLMGPMFGVALSLTSGDKKLLRHALISETLGMMLAVLIGYLIGLAPLRLDFGSEILARTEPTLYDMMIAIASGVAGAYAMIKEKLSPVLPGVAIATALVPPLTVCGLCLAAQQWQWALGAFLLFFANFLAIHLVASGVFILFGMTGIRLQQTINFQRACKRFGLSFVLLLGVGAFMTNTLVNILRERQFANAVEATLGKAVRENVGAYLEATQFDYGSDRTEVIATVLTPQEFAPDEVATLENKLRRAVSPDIHLVVRSLISKDADRNGAVYIARAARQNQSEAEAAAARQTRFLTIASRVLNDQLAQVRGGTLDDLSRDDGDEATTVTATVRTPDPVEPAQVKAIEAVLQEALQKEWETLREADATTPPLKPLRLVVRSILTRDADAQNYLYDPQPRLLKIDTERIRWHNRIEEALENQLPALASGASLEEFQFDKEGRQLRVMAVARTPQQFSPAQVARLQAIFRRFVHPNTQLVVRSRVGADANPYGYGNNFR